MTGPAKRTVRPTAFHAAAWLALTAALAGCADPSRRPGQAIPAGVGEDARTDTADAGAAVARDTPEWLTHLALEGPPGARQERGPGTLPYFWRGAPLELVIDLAPGVREGSLEIAWRDEQGEIIEEQALRLRESLTGPGPVVRLPVPEGAVVEPGTYRVEVRWIPKQPRLLPEGELAFGIGEPPQATIVPDDTPAFPWPPPSPTSRHVIEGTRLGGGRPPESLGDAADRLLAALDAAGYSEHAYFSIRPDPSLPPEGFALVTRLEQIFPDGRPRPGDERWRMELPAREVFSLEGLIEALFTAPQGHYRVIVFAVTGRPVAPSEEEPTREDAGEWLGRGLARLPRALAELPWTPDHACTALIYQFRQVGAGNPPQVNPPGAPPARIQLERTGILSALGGG